jgi:hypothetical protein
MSSAPFALFLRIIRAPVFGRAYSAAPTLFHSDSYGVLRKRGSEVPKTALNSDRPYICDCPRGGESGSLKVVREGPRQLFSFTGASPLCQAMAFWRETALGNNRRQSQQSRVELGLRLSGGL